MKNVIEPLFELQALEQQSSDPEQDAVIQRLRKKVPPQILAHYDRLRARGKRGVAVVRNGVCAECHMRLSSGTYATLRRFEDILICDSCGRSVHLPASEIIPVEPPPVSKPSRARAGKASGARKTTAAPRVPPAS
jgi:predicted  nucleic acid-binding Zn-ribbon protein